MNTIIRTVNGVDYLEIELIQFIQKGQPFYISKISAELFLNIYTVRPAKYDLYKHTILASTFPDDEKYYNHLINEDKQNLEGKDFQRDANDTRVNQIAKFLNKEDFAFFPNTIIANCDLINDLEEYDFTLDTPISTFYQLEDKPSYLCFLSKNDNTYKLTVPYREGSVLIIDGQHRLKGLENCGSEFNSNYDLLIAFIIGFDRSVIAKQFYTINYEQKPVNKSLLYQLTGEFTRDINELSFMHNIVKLLNELPESPFYSRIKMLGIAPKDVDPVTRQKYSISQAFLVDSMIRFVSTNALNTTYPPIFLKYYQNTEEHIYIVRSIARFFNAVKQIMPEWDNPSQSLLSKGMGVGALLKVFNLLFPIIFKREMNMEWDNISKLNIVDYKTILSGIENVDFSSNGEFGKSGSAGSINKIKETIIRKLAYTGSPDSYQEFEEIYKNDYLPNFNALLLKLSKKNQSYLPL